MLPNSGKGLYRHCSAAQPVTRAMPKLYVVAVVAQADSALIVQDVVLVLLLSSRIITKDKAKGNRQERHPCCAVCEIRLSHSAQAEKQLAVVLTRIRFDRWSSKGSSYTARPLLVNSDSVRRGESSLHNQDQSSTVVA